MNEHQRIDNVTDRLLAMEQAVAEIKPQLKNCNTEPEDKYKLEQEFIVRYLIQQGYEVEEEALFETIVAIVSDFKAEMEIGKITLRG